MPPWRRNSRKWENPPNRIGFIFGLFATVAEPALSVLAKQISALQPLINNTLFIWITGAGIGFGVALAVLPIVIVSIPVLLTVVDREKAVRIMAKVKELAGVGTPAHGLCFFVPVEMSTLSV